jgi:hypothetical protein
MSPSKLLPFLLLGAFLGLPAWPASMVDTGAPRGRFAELHSCEVFAGPCVVNSEVDQAGNYVLRVWQFDQGAMDGVALHGLTVALLEKGESDKTLAVAASPASDAVAYLPPGLSSAQQTALLAWARQNTTVRLDGSRVRIASLQVDFAGGNVRFSAGTEITFTGGTAAACAVGGCGEMLWYQPRSAASSFVVDQLGQSRIVEPLLELRWMDHGRRTLFVGRFGDPELRVPALCGAPATAAL